MYTLLIADDEIRDRQFLKKYITSEYKNSISIVGICDNGLDACKKATRLKPDIILLDIVMPIMDGLEAAAKMRETNPEARIVIISAHSVFDYAKKAINIGVTDYLLKPYLEDEIDEVIQRILKHLEKSRKNDSINLDDLFPSKNSPYVRLAIKYLIKNHAQNLTLQTVAEYLKVSSGYLGKSFKKTTGQHFNSVLTKIRIEQSKELLKIGFPTVSEVAERCGFRDAPYFTKCFKKETGETPKNYSILYSGT